MVCWVLPTLSNDLIEIPYFYEASLHFCQECNNLLYPKVDQGRSDMVYACRICQYDEKVDNQCVYRNDLLTVTKYVGF